MRTLNEMLGMGLAVVVGEVRSAKPDSFSYINKKTGLKVEVKLVRLGLEVGDQAEQCEARVDVEVVPDWAKKGKQYYFGCDEVLRENRRMSVRIKEVAEME